MALSMTWTILIVPPAAPSLVASNDASPRVAGGAVILLAGRGGTIASGLSLLSIVGVLGPKEREEVRHPPYSEKTGRLVRCRSLGDHPGSRAIPQGSATSCHYEGVIGRFSSLASFFNIDQGNRNYD